MYISGKLLKFSVNELLKFRYISKINTCIVLRICQLKHCFDLLHLYMHIHTRAHKDTHAHTQTLIQIKILLFFGKIVKRNQILKQLRQSWSAKFNTSEIHVF